MPSLSATPYSCWITAPRVPIFRAVMLTSCIAPSSGCWPCPRKRACSGATTTRRPVAMPTPGRRRSATVGEEYPRRRRQDRSCVRRDADFPRRYAVRADAFAAFNPGQHPRRRVSPGGRQRGALSENTGDLQGGSQGSAFVCLIRLDCYRAGLIAMPV